MKIKTDIKDMKIEINEDQPILEVCKELDRLGYRRIGWIGYSKPNYLTANSRGFFTDHVTGFMDCFLDGSCTTLTELRAMECL